MAGDRFWVPDEDLSIVVEINLTSALMLRNSVELVTITAEDLAYEGMLRKIPKNMPLTGITKDDPRVVFLEKLCRAYRKMDRG